MVSSPFFCYIIASPDGRTYNGFTNNIDRRLKQHCGILPNGAKATRGRQWSYIVIIECIDSSYPESLSLEYHIKYPTNKKPRPKEFCNPKGRIKSLLNVFTNLKFIEKSFIVTVVPEYFELLQNLCQELSNVLIQSLEI
jgi:predicted GIY-YIG superfamily endonuclease